MQYCLDANIFIEAKNRYYHFDICPGFWDWLDQQGGVVGSILPVCDELMDGNDTLAKWAKDRKGSGLFTDISDVVIQEFFREIAVFVTNNYEAQHANKFMDDADPWLIAYAHVNDCCVVTSEILAPGAKKLKFPISVKSLGLIIPIVSLCSRG